MTKIIDNLKTLRKKGIAGVVRRVRETKRKRQQNKTYTNWVRGSDLTADNRTQIRREIAKFSYKPLISIVLPVYDVNEKWLRRCIESVLRQIYENWEFCIADDYSTKKHIRRVLEEYQTLDPRVKVVFRTSNGHISAATNSALELINGEFIGFLDHDDELSEDALFSIAETLIHNPDADLIYTDEDKIDENDLRSKPTYKPEWDEDLFHSMNFLNHFSVYRSEVVRRIKGLRAGFEGSQDYDLALRAIETIDAGNIVHVPKILYHWRMIAGSVALAANEKPYAHEIARNALREHFSRKNLNVTVEKGFENYHRIKYQVPTGVTSEIISDPNFTAARYNELAGYSKNDVLIFVDPELRNFGEAPEAELIGHALRMEIGAVGGRILYPNQSIYSCGIKINGGEELLNNGFPRDHAGNLASGQVVANVDAVHGVVAVRRELFERINGFDESAENFEFEFCQRLRRLNYRILFTPYAEFIRIKP